MLVFNAILSCKKKCHSMVMYEFAYKSLCLIFTALLFMVPFIYGDFVYALVCLCNCAWACILMGVLSGCLSFYRSGLSCYYRVTLYSFSNNVIYRIELCSLCIGLLSDYYDGPLSPDLFCDVFM